MSNPKFRLGPITVQAGDKLEKFRFVKLNGDGNAVHAGASDVPHGAVSEAAQSAAQVAAADASRPVDVALHIAGVVDIETADTSIKRGAPIFVAADGKAAKSGTVQAGWAESAANGRVAVVLTLPAQPNPAA